MRRSRRLATALSLNRAGNFVSPLLLPLALMCSAVATAKPIDPAGGRIVGEWRGSSLCTNLKLTPACKDETVRYVFTGPIGGANTYHLVADKLVGKSYETMGEFDLTYSSVKRTWTVEFKTRQFPKCTWWYRVEGSGLMGGLTTDTGDTLRKVSAKRYSR